jgi:hypothetical protein
MPGKARQSSLHRHCFSLKFIHPNPNQDSPTK